MKGRYLTAIPIALASASPTLAQEMDHASHAMPAPSTPEPETVSPMDNSAPAPMHHTGMDHGAHRHGPPATAEPPVTPIDPRAFAGPDHAADRYFDPALMARTRKTVYDGHGNMVVSKVMLDRLEAQFVDGRDGYSWEGEAWIGNDENKLWLKSDGDGALGDGPEEAEVQTLWSRPANAWFDMQLGLRHDFRAGPERTYLVAGVEGLLPYWLEVGGALFLSEQGNLSARAEVEYDWRITSRIIVQPSAALDLALKDERHIGVGAGLSKAEIGVRTRYHLTRQFAPYIGVESHTATGRTRRFLREEGEAASGTAAVAGVRFWF